jgi:hypothetical protein
MHSRLLPAPSPAPRHRAPFSRRSRPLPPTLNTHSLSSTLSGGGGGEGDRGGGGGGGGSSRGPGACYAFQRGECTRGDACRFSHDAAAAARNPPPTGPTGGYGGGSYGGGGGGNGGGGGARGGTTEPPPLMSVQKGRVVSVRPFGLFVRMEGFARDGLVHMSQVSDDLTFQREDSDDAKVMAMVRGGHGCGRGSKRRTGCRVWDLERHPTQKSSARSHATT